MRQTVRARSTVEISRGIRKSERAARCACASGRSCGGGASPCRRDSLSTYRRDNRCAPVFFSSWTAWSKKGPECNECGCVEEIVLIEAAIKVTVGGRQRYSFGLSRLSRQTVGGYSCARRREREYRRERADNQVCMNAWPGVLGAASRVPIASCHVSIPTPIAQARAFFVRSGNPMNYIKFNES